MPHKKNLAHLMPVFPELLRAIGDAASGAHDEARRDYGRAASLIREAEAILHEMAMPLPSRFQNLDDLRQDDGVVG